MSEQPLDNKKYNPLSGASIDKILEAREEDERKKAILKEEIAEYKLVLNRLAQTPDGQYFLGKLIRFSGVFSFDSEINPAKMVEDRGKRKAYLELVRPFLDISNRIELESKTL